MKLIGNLKEKVEKAKTSEEAKEIIQEAGMELTDEEMSRVAGGTPAEAGRLSTIVSTIR